MTAPRDYIKGLDSIRAISMILVLLVHMRLLGFGWVTIQTFFVMSGFLITRILLNMRERHEIGGYLKIFYMRRTLRIFPIYYLVLCLFVAVVLAAGIQGPEREQSIYAFFYVWNWFAAFHEGPQANALSHFWSLAVEEQFYLAWPLLVFFARGATFWKVALAIVLAGPVLRLGAALLWPHLDGVLADTHKAVYQLSTTHLDAFATGALLCYVVKDPRSRRFTATHLMLAAVLAVALGMLASGPGIRHGGPYNVPFNFGYPIHMAQNWQFVWGYSVLNLLSAALLLLVAQGRFLTPLFQNRLLTRMGTITYGAYVIHLPLMHLCVPWVKAIQSAVGSNYWGAWVASVPLLILTFTLAELSYRVYESRFLVLKDAKYGSAGPSVIAAGTAASPPAPVSGRT